MIVFSSASMAVAVFSLAPSPHSQPLDTNAVRAAFTAAEAYEADSEKRHGHVVEVHGFRLHYFEWGDKAGVPLVWAHGSRWAPPTSSHHWRRDSWQRDIG